MDSCKVVLRDPVNKFRAKQDIRAMQPNEELCLCFHVTRRKVANFIALEKPRRASQLANCYGAGTGCGWCRPYLQRMFEAMQDSKANSEDADFRGELPTADEYSSNRRRYIDAGRGQPPS
ncbi:MAG: (2Fe-2S)-binding protein [Pirellulales bacterium]